MSDVSPPSPVPRPTRWWPLWWIVGLGLMAQAVIAVINHPSVQQRWMVQAATGMLTVLLIVLWFFLFSRLPGRWRWRAAVGLLIVMGLVSSLFSYAGTSGDLVPQFRWRWTKTGPPRLKPKEAAENALPPTPPGAVDFPQFLGPQRNGKLTSPILARDWTTEPPKELWRQEVGQAWSGFAVVGGVAVTQEQREEQELVVAYDLLTGQLLWSHADEARYDNALGGVGPRATPTIVDGTVYTMGGTGILNCLQLSTGKLLWSKNIIASHGAAVPEWGASSSPLIRGQMVIVTPGQEAGATLAAYHRNDGTRLWISGNQTASYSSPVLCTLADTEQLLYFGPKALASFDPASGKLLWDFPWFAESKFPHVMSPVPLFGDAVLISAGYGQGSGLTQISKQADGTWKATETWQTKRMKAKFTNYVEHHGLIYGLDDGVLACLNPAKDQEGRQLWRDGKYGHGQLLLVGELLLIMAEEGDLVLVDPNPDGLKEITRMSALTKKTWNPPALAGEYLLLRNSLEAVCYRMPLAK